MKSGTMPVPIGTFNFWSKNRDVEQYIYIYIYNYLYIISIHGDHRGAGAQGCDNNVTVVGSILTRGLFINIFISSSWHQSKSSANQHAMPQKIRIAENGKRSVLTLGSLSLRCYMRDIAWSWDLYISCQSMFQLVQ